MPKIVDHDARRQEIADGMWRVLNRDGIQGVTVRSVAGELGVSKGTLRHYFDSQDALIIFALNQSVEHVSAGLETLEGSALDLDSATKILSQVIPTTAARRRQAETWLATLAHVPGSADVARRLAAVNKTIFDRISAGLAAMQENGLVAKHRDLRLEAMRVHALVDGLSLHTLTDPATARPVDIKRIVRAHLEELAN